jgi:putative membrane protein
MVSRHYKHNHIIYRDRIGGGAVALVVWMVRQLTQRNDTPCKNTIDIVKERYAKGEINKEQFEQIKKDLR